MAVSSHHVLPVLLAVWCAGAMAYYEPRDIERLTGVGMEDDSPPHLLHRRLSGKYLADQGEWAAAPDPRLYVLTEGGTSSQEDDDDAQEETSQRVKRDGPSLSIVNSLDVLRQRLLLEIARRRMRQSEDQILANREILKSIGKREISQSEHGNKRKMTSAVHENKNENIRSPVSSSDSEWTAKTRNYQQQL